MELFSAIGKLLSLILDSIMKVIELLKKLTLKVTVGLAVFVLVVAAVAIGYLWGVSGGSNQPVASPAPSNLGGVDLTGYCESFGYDTNSGDELCVSSIDLDDACDWEKGGPGHELVFSRTDDPLSGVCFNSEDEPVGGIQNMTGYCQSSFNGTADVVAALADEEAWVCQMDIVMNHVCTWQYPVLDIEARKVDGLWYCFP